MAHNLYMKSGQAQIMFVNKVPWHGLGTMLDKPATSAEAITAAGLDWNVKKVPLYAIEGSGVAHVPYRFAVVPENRWGVMPDCPVFGVVSDGYTPLQNIEAFEFFDSIVGSDAAIYHTAGALGQGEKIWLLAKLPGMMEFADFEEIEKYVLLSTGHDGRTCVRILLTPVRVVCQNTLTMALEEGQELARAYHTPELFHQLDEAKNKLRVLNNAFGDMADTFKKMLKKKINDQQVRDYGRMVLPDPADARDRMIPRWIIEDREGFFHYYREGTGNDQGQAKGTLWAAYNGVTEYLDHGCRRGREDRMTWLYFGRAHQIKTKAFKVASQMVE